jgi:serine/threonine protein kinase
MQMNSFLRSIKYMTKSGHQLQYNGINLVSTGLYKNKTHVFKKIPNKHVNPFEIEVLEKNLSCNIPLVDKYIDNDNTYLIFPYYPRGDLFNYLNSNLPLSERDTKDTIRKLIDLVLPFHEEGYVHLDLKLENFIMTDRDQYKLIDFGSVHPIISQETENLHLIKEKIGTNSYLSPEAYLNYYHPKSDVWSLGIITYCLIVGKPLYNNVFEYLTRNSYLNMWDLSDEGKDILNKMLKPKCSERISLEECLKHDWLKI